METITIYPRNKKQESLLKSILDEMKIPFEVEEQNENSFLSKEEFYAKIDKSIQQAESGKTKTLTKEKQKELLGL